MNEYNITDYSMFQNAITTTNNLVTSYNDSNTIIEECKKIISDSSIFLGPVAEVCIECINKLTTSSNETIEVLNAINKYLTEAEELYKKGDADASSLIGQTTNTPGNMTTGVVEGTTYNLINGKADTLEYARHILKDKVAETKNVDKYSGNCLGFAVTHAWGMYTNNKSYTAEDGLHYRGGSHFEKYSNDNKEEFLAKVYQELVNNKPVVIQVNGNRNGTSRHFVTAVGFKNTVKSASDLKESDLLIIDSYDGKLETMDKSGSRFLTTGAKCGKKYSGYHMRYIAS